MKLKLGKEGSFCPNYCRIFQRIPQTQLAKGVVVCLPNLPLFDLILPSFYIAIESLENFPRYWG